MSDGTGPDEQLDRIRAQLARWCADADSAGVSGDPAWLASSMRGALPLVVEDLVERLEVVARLAVTDFEAARVEWTILRDLVRARRPIEN